MWKYVVIWVLVSEIPTSLEPSTNEFGQTGDIIPSIYTFTTTTENKIEYFKTKEDAENFYRRAKEQEKISDMISGPGDRINDVHIYKLYEIKP